MTFPLPKYLQLYPTTSCNQTCSFCFNSPSAFTVNMSLEKALKLLNTMLNLGIHDLDIMGGEPFLLSWMPTLIHTAIEKNIMVNISTNGSFPEAMNEFKGLDPGQINIGISLEGSSADKHNRLTHALNFEKTLYSISSLVSMGLNPIVKTVVTGETMPGIPSLADLLMKLGVRRYYLIHMDMLSNDHGCQQSAICYPDFIAFYNSIRAKQRGDMQIFKVHASCFERETLPKGMRCAGGVRKLSVMPDGAAYPCNLFQHAPEFNLGNIFTDTFTDIWSNPKLTFFRSYNGNSCPLTSCSNHISCTGGCPAHARVHGQTPHGMDIRCRRRSAP